MSTVLKRNSMVNLTTSQGDCSDQVQPDQMVLGTVRWEAYLKGGGQSRSKLSYLKWDFQAQVCSDQMVLVQVRWEAGPHYRQPKTL
jgi:hypothetical protein